MLAIVILRERLTRSHVAGIVLTAVSIVLITAGATAPEHPVNARPGHAEPLADPDALVPH